jgi:hypothetical protein
MEAVEERPDRRPAATRIFDYEAAERHEEAERAERRAQRQAFLEKILTGSDMHSWIVPDGNVPADQVLEEHLLQLRNVTRYAMQYALDDDYGLQSNLKAADTVTRMVRANIALAKELKASSNSKTVRGAKRRKGAQD